MKLFKNSFLIGAGLTSGSIIGLCTSFVLFSKACDLINAKSESKGEESDE